MKSLKQIALDYIKSRRCWVSSGDIEREAKDNKYLGRTVIRRCQELRADGLLLRKIVNGVCWYRYPKS
ncbi:MAG: hypothetical protein WC551_02770 [Patescibacteria group bacterium]